MAKKTTKKRKHARITFLLGGRQRMGVHNFFPTSYQNNFPLYRVPSSYIQATKNLSLKQSSPICIEAFSQLPAARSYAIL